MTSAQTDKIVADLLTRCNYKYKDLCKRDISSTLGYFKELSPKQDRYVYPNGQIKELITLVGTIPVNFRNSRYNIPVQLYLSDLHPYTPPIAYVRPTPDMSINVSETVDSNGRVVLPCLSEWNYPNSDIYMLLNFMTIRFSENTPLFARQANKPATASSIPSTTNNSINPPYPTDNFGTRPTYQMPGTGSVSNNAAYPVYPPVTESLQSYSAATSNHYSANNPYYPMTTPYPPVTNLKSGSSTSIGQTRPALPPQTTTNFHATSGSSSYTDDTIKPEYYRMSLISAIQDKLRVKYNEYYEEKMAEVDSLKRVNNDLKQSQAYLDSIIGEAESECINIKDLTRELKDKSSMVNKKINRIQLRDSANIEDAIITPTPLYRQLFNLYVEELAIQDLIYYLSEGLYHKTITLDNFLRQVRSLTRKQFLLRATMQKAREKAALPI